ncbi:DUF4393 domain-containing protein [Clostridium manihotivorum]|uniref:DUF4393 domain-containing protein n=1 Tax=Clostridium manihotivorum TaxID=2320868 RepID=A0A3R5UE03_9CLOT|nr:DUF4393 domain-containing protein [Clostridium manihotivorum]QAA31226.1 hypothetical protein C1I91_05965 [Clostridium manihotivorum]
MGETKINASLVNVDIPEFLDKAATPPAQEAGKALANIFYAIFSPINYSVEKMRIRHNLNLKKYEEELNEELNKIPENKLVEPPLNVVGPAIESSKFYIEDEKTRKMFAKLIASSMNIDLASKSHPSFVEIIKQLSPLDASNFKIIFEGERLPIVKYLGVDQFGNSATAITNVFLSNTAYGFTSIIASSISNLERLGLVSITYTDRLADDNEYLMFYTDPDYLNLMDEINKERMEDPNYFYLTTDIKKGIISLTPFGQDFASICL